MSSMDIFNETASSQASSAKGQAQHFNIVRRNFDSSPSQLSSSIPHKKRKSEPVISKGVASTQQRSSHVDNIENMPQQSFNEEVLSLLKNIDQRLKRVENTLCENVIERSELMAQNKLIRECKVVLKKVHQSVCLMTGETEDSVVIEITSTLPLNSLGAADEVEENLKRQEYAQAMKTYLHKLKGASEDVDAVLRRVFSDELLNLYNWDGRCEKRALVKMVLVEEILSDVFKTLGRYNFEKEVKKAVEKSHNRLKQKKRLQLKANQNK